ncbi:MAG: NUDIX domain-containing protein [Anaerolineaceae bacterium]
MTSGSRESPFRRDSARVLLLDPEGRLLLFRSSFMDAETGLPVWFTPGGGVEPGESHEDAARREVIEETGMTDVVFGPWVWVREYTAVWLGSERHGEWFHADERYRLARASGCEISRVGWTELELSDIAEHRWWTVAEIAATNDAVFAPRRLATLLPAVLAGDLPPEPIRLD